MVSEKGLGTLWRSTKLWFPLKGEHKSWWNQNNGVGHRILWYLFIALFSSAKYTIKYLPSANWNVNIHLRPHIQILFILPCFLISSIWPCVCVIPFLGFGWAGSIVCLTSACPLLLYLNSFVPLSVPLLHGLWLMWPAASLHLTHFCCLRYAASEKKKLSMDNSEDYKLWHFALKKWFGSSWNAKLHCLVYQTLLWGKIVSLKRKKKNSNANGP